MQVVSTVRQMAPLPLVVLMFCPSITGVSTEGTTTGAEAQRLKIAWQVLTLHWALELTCTIKHDGISAASAGAGCARCLARTRVGPDEVVLNEPGK